MSVARGNNKTIWIVDNNRIRVITLNLPFNLAFNISSNNFYNTINSNNTNINGSVSTLAGSTLQGEQDGIGKDSTFFEPVGLFVSPDDGVGYVTDTASCHVRTVSPLPVVSREISCGSVITSLIRPSGCTSYDQVRYCLAYCSKVKFEIVECTFIFLYSHPLFVIVSYVFFYYFI